MDITKISTKPAEGTKKNKTKEKFLEIVAEIGELSKIMYAQRKYSLLVIFQGMDSSGKDGTTRKVFADVPAYAVNVKGFGKPTDEEFAHDFLWRCHKHTPGKGKIQVFNRSHYEDILIQRVHKWISEDRVDARVKAINAFEELLQVDNNTIVLKFYLHLSYEKQEEKLQERIDVPEKNYKHNPNDWKEREHWDKYMDCYNEAINRCDSAPWTVIPADSRWYRNYMVAKKVLETIKGLDLEYPTLKED